MKCSRSWTRLLAVLVLTSAARSQWVTTSTDTITNTIARKWMTMQSLARDSSGCLHACWVEAAGAAAPKDIYYARKPVDSAWTSPLLVADSAANHAAMAVGWGDGAAHIACAWQWGTTEDVCYLTNRSGEWTDTRITNDTLYGHTPTIALEADSIPHIAWITTDASRAYRIAHVSNRSGTWQTYVLSGSRLGGFGLGAAPWIEVSPQSRVHVTYRGGDYPDYHVHHAQNSNPEDTVWTYEALVTGNPYDYTSAAYAADSGELFVVIAGNEGWGMPFHTYFLHRPPGTNQWDQYQLMTASASADLRGFTMDRGSVQATWEPVNGNIREEKLYHCSNSRGYWFNSNIRDDGITGGGSLVVDDRHSGHCLMLVGAAMDSQQVYCANSAPLPGVESSRPAERLSRMLVASPARPPVRFECPAVDVYALDGRPVHQASVPVWDGTDQQGRVLPQGTYIARLGPLSQAFVLTR
jgi:hypothetical protein